MLPTSLPRSPVAAPRVPPPAMPAEIGAPLRGSESGATALIARLQCALADFSVEPLPKGYDEASRRAHEAAASRCYALSPPDARNISGYDDAQLSMAFTAQLSHYRTDGPSRIYLGEAAPTEGRKGEMFRFLGTQPYRALHTLVTCPGPFTMSDLRVVTFYLMCDGATRYHGVPFLLVAPGIARYFDHEGDDRGIELEALSAFIDRHRDAICFVDVAAPNRADWLWRFDDGTRLPGTAGIEQHLRDILRRASVRYVVLEARGPVRVIASSREATRFTVDDTLRFPSLHVLRKLHRLDLPGGPPGGRSFRDGTSDAEAFAPYIEQHRQQAVAIGFADIGFRRRTDPRRAMPSALPSLYEQCRLAAEPLCQLTACGDDMDLQRLGRLTQTILDLVANAGRLGTVSALREALPVLRRFAELGRDLRLSPALLEAVQLMAQRLDVVHQAILDLDCRDPASAGGIVSVPSPDADFVTIKERAMFNGVLDEACQAVFVTSVDAPDGSGTLSFVRFCALEAAVSALNATLFSDHFPTKGTADHATLARINDLLEDIRELDRRRTRAQLVGALAAAVELVKGLHALSQPVYFLLDKGLGEDFRAAAVLIRDVLLKAQAKVARIALAHHRVVDKPGGN